jgi:hypothetical protein
VRSSEEVAEGARADAEEHAWCAVEAASPRAVVLASIRAARRDIDLALGWLDDARRCRAFEATAIEREAMDEAYRRATEALGWVTRAGELVNR